MDMNYDLSSSDIWNAYIGYDIKRKQMVVQNPIHYNY